MLTTEQLQAIRERVNKSTPGAWYWSLSENAFYTLKRPVICVVEDGTLKFSPEDADFITFAREDVPALLAYTDSLKKDAENIASAFSKVNRENLHLKDQIERLRGALVQVQNERLPKLYPDKEDMPKTLEYAYERGYVDALESVFQIARQALAGAST